MKKSYFWDYNKLMGLPEKQKNNYLLGINVSTLGTNKSGANLYQSLSDLPDFCVVNLVSPKCTSLEFREKVQALLKGTEINFICDDKSGIYNSFNLGLARSKANWTIFLNDDDEFEKNSMQKIKKKLESSKSVMIYGNYYLIESEIKTLIKAKPPEYIRSFIAKGRMVTSHQAQIWRTEVLRNLGTFRREISFEFSPLNLKLSLQICSDFDLYVRANSKGLAFEYLDQTISSMGIFGVSNTRIYRRSFENVGILYVNKQISKIRALFRILYLTFSLSIRKRRM